MSIRNQHILYRLCIVLLFSSLCLAGMGQPDSRSGLTGCQSWLPVQQNSKWGFINRSGELQIPTTYDEVTLFNSRGYAIVGQDYQYGLIDSTGRKSIPLQYDHIIDYGADVVGVQQDSKWYLSTRNAVILLNEPSRRIETVSPDLYVLEQEENALLITARGDILSRNVGDRNELAEVLLFKDDAGWHLYDFTGRDIPGVPLDSFLALPRNLYGWSAENKWGLANSDTVLLEAKYDSVVNAPPFIQLYLNGKSSYYDPISKSMRFDAEANYQRITRSPWDNYFYTYDGGLMGLIGPDGTEFMEAVYTSIRRHSSGVWIVKTFDGYGIISAKGDELLPCVYSWIFWYETGWFGVVRDRKKGVFSSSGRELIPAQYDRLEVWKDRVKAFDGTDMILYEMDGDRVVDRYSYQNVLSIRVTGNGGNMGQQLRAFPLGQRNGNRRTGWYQSRATGRWWGLRDTSGTTQIAPKYDEVSISDSLGVTVVTHVPDNPRDRVYYLRGAGELKKKSVGYGIVDHRQYIEIVKPTYQSITSEDFINGNRVARYISESFDYGMMTKTGRKVASGLKYMGDFNEALCRANRGGQLYADNYQRTESIEGLNEFVRRNFWMGTDTLNGMFADERLNQKWLMVSGGKWGFYNRRGDVAIPFDYQYAGDFIKAVSIVKKEGKFGIINPQNVPVIDFEFDEIKRLEHSSDTVFELRARRSYNGYINLDGEHVVECLYEKTGEYIDGIALVKTKQGWNYIDLDGNVLSKEYFNQAHPFGEEYATVRQGRKWGFMDQYGELVIDAEYRQAGDFHEGMAWVVLKNKRGFIDESGEMVIPELFRKTGDFHNGLAPAATIGRLGLIDKQGEFRVAQKYKMLEPLPNTRLWKCQKSRNKGIITAKGKVVLPPKYQEVGDCHEGLIAVKRKNRWSFVDTTGRPLSKEKYDAVLPFSEGMAAVKCKNLWGYINNKGEEIIACNYKEAFSFKEGRAVVHTREGGFYSIDSKGKRIAPSRYRNMLPYSDGLAVAKDRDGKYFYVDKDGKKVSNATFDKAKTYRDGKALVMQKRKWGMIDLNGRWIIKPRFDGLRYSGNGMYTCLIKDLKGIGTASGQILCDPTYETIEPMGDGLLKVVGFGNTGYITATGVWLWKPQQ